MKKIVIVGGGSGGHFFVSDTILSGILEKLKNSKILFVCKKKSQEKKIFEKKYGDKIKIKEICAGKLRRYFSLQNFLDFFRFFFGIFQSFFILKKFKANLIFSCGGFVSLPVVIAGYFLRIPVVVHENDSISGLANRISSLFASKITSSFDMSKKKIIFTGHPIRKEIINANKKKGLEFLDFDEKKAILFIWGGSQGAMSINNLFDKISNKIGDKIQIVIIGTKKKIRTKNRVSFEFLENNVGDVLACADLIISRAGASSIFESAYLKKTQILIPLPNSANNHQANNAITFLNKKSCIILNDKIENHEIFIKIILDLIFSKKKSQNIGENAKKYFGKSGTNKIIDVILEVLEK